MIAYNIKWDANSEEELDKLPKDIILPERFLYSDFNEISNFICLKIGHDHHGFKIKRSLYECLLLIKKAINSGLIEMKNDMVASYEKDSNEMIYQSVTEYALELFKDIEKQQYFVEAIKKC